MPTVRLHRLRYGRAWGPLWAALCIFLAPLAASAFTATSRANGNWNVNATWSTTRTGNITATAGSTALTGAGTDFTAELAVGVVVTNASDVVIGTVASISSNTALTLTAPAPAAYVGAYKVRVAPRTTDDVQIGNLGAAHVVTVTAAATCASLSFVVAAPGGDQNSDLRINNGVTLTVTGDATIGPTNVNNRTKRIDVLAGGTLVVRGNMTLTGGAGLARRAELRLGNNAATRVTIAGDLTTPNVNSRVVFSGLGVLAIGGNYPTGGTLVFVNAQPATVVFNGSGNQLIGSRSYPGLSVTKPAGTATLAGDIGIAGNLTDDGRLDATTSPCGKLQVTFNGTIPQNVQGAATSTGFCILTIQNTAGAVANRNVTISHDVVVGIRLNLNNGRVVTGSNTVILSGSAFVATAAGAPNNRYIAGRLRLTISAGASVRTFDVGVVSPTLAYAPVRLSFPAGTASGTLTVFTTSGDHPNLGASGLDPARSVNRYWTFQNGGIGVPPAGYAATFTFVAGDRDPGANTANFLVRRFVSPAWFTTTIGTRTATTTQATQINGFGDFAIAEAGAIHHFAINIGAAAASTCAPKHITITAQNIANATQTGYTGTINITTSSGHGDWTRFAATGTLNNGAADDGAASYAYTGAGAGRDNGVITLDLSNAHADDLTVTVQDTLLPSTRSTSAAISFRDDAFVITQDPITVAGRDQVMSVAMWRKDPGTGNCAIATTYNGARSLDAWIGRDASDPGGDAPRLGAVSLPNAPPGGLGADNISLTFTNGVAGFNLRTTDVGKYTLNLRDDSRSFANAVDIGGATGVLTVRPFGLHIDVPGNPAADTATGAILTRAGGDFTGLVRGVLWQAADDSNNDGVPDGDNSTLADNTAAPHFAWPTTLSAAAPFAPATGVLGALNNGSIAQAQYAGGVATVNNLQYTEVGSFTLTATAGGYLNTAGVDITANAGVVGRFTPFDFAAGLNTPAFATACTTGDFTYIGQKFSYSVQPLITITARNAQGDTTRNYTGHRGVAGAPAPAGPNNWWKITDAKLAADGGKSYTTAAGALDTGLIASPDPAIADNGDGTGTLTFNSGGGLAFTRGGPIAPFDADISLSINVVDEDNIANAGNPARFGQATAGNGIAFTDGNAATLNDKRMRWGRLRLDNAFGSELLALTVPLHAEYFDGNTFVTNTGDDCTSLDLAAGVELSNPDTAGGATQPGTAIMTIAGGTTRIVSGTPVTLAAGVAGFTFSAPGTGNLGFVNVRLNLTNFPWLLFDWDGNGVHDNAPSARASFGVFSGPRQYIYIREPWN